MTLEEIKQIKINNLSRPKTPQNRWHTTLFVGKRTDWIDFLRKRFLSDKDIEVKKVTSGRNIPTEVIYKDIITGEEFRWLYSSPNDLPYIGRGLRFGLAIVDASIDSKLYDEIIGPQGANTGADILFINEPEEIDE